MPPYMAWHTNVRTGHKILSNPNHAELPVVAAENWSQLQSCTYRSPFKQCTWSYGELPSIPSRTDHVFLQIVEPGAALRDWVGGGWGDNPGAARQCTLALKWVSGRWGTALDFCLRSKAGPCLIPETGLTSSFPDPEAVLCCIPPLSWVSGLGMGQPPVLDTCHKFNSQSNTNQPQRCSTFYVEYLWCCFAILLHHKLVKHAAFYNLWHG